MLPLVCSVLCLLTVHFSSLHMAHGGISMISFAVGMQLDVSVASLPADGLHSGATCCPSGHCS